MKAKITKRFIESVAPGNRDIFIWNTEVSGFGCKITPNGVRTYVLQYRMRDRARRYTLDRHGWELTANEARRGAIGLRGDISRGTDPEAARTEMFDVWTALNEEDIGIVEGQQKGRAAPAFDGGVLSPYWDGPASHYFVQLIAEAMTV